jgi:hypothetical protein
MNNGPAQNLIEVLLAKKFDYAGMFPPAALNLEQAIKECLEHPRTLTRPWLVGTELVLTTPNAKQLANIGDLEDRLLTVSILVTDGAKEALEAARALSAVEDNKRFKVVSFEAKISNDNLAGALEELGSYASENEVIIALEPDLSVEGWRSVLNDTVGAIKNSPLKKNLALKCRCTGDTGIKADRLAGAIATAADAEIGFKVTGGFHHPIVEPEGSPMGFLNLTCAVYIRRALGNQFPEDQIADLLTNDSLNRLSLNAGIRFDEVKISPEQLTTAMNIAPFSIGSCSIREPDQDLTRLKL